MLKPKDLMMVPARVALALQADGWFLRSMMPWVKRSCMPESVSDRPTSAIEYVFLLTKGPSYFWDAEAVKRQGAYPAGTRAAKGSAERSGTNGVNSRPPEYAIYSGTRNFRNSDLFFDSLLAPYGLISDAEGEPLALDVNPEPTSEAHFAAFPTGLVTPLIRAATSERGCCPACGAQWGRETEKSRQFVSGSGRSGNLPTGKNGAAMQGGGATLDVRRGPIVHATTTGWAPTCACPAHEPIASTVLDPFAGIGRTLTAADRLGRDAIGIELNPVSVAIAWKLIQAEHPHERVSPLPDPEPGPLFR